MRYIPAIIIALALMLVPVIWHVAGSFRDNGGTGSAVDSVARIEIEELRFEFEAIQQ